MDRAAYDLARYHERMARLRALLGGACVKCSSQEGLHFDHVDPTSKSFTITVEWWRPWGVLLAEAAKCQLLCGACHREKSKSDGSMTNRAKGERIHQARLTEADVRRIRKLHNQGVGHQELATMFNVSRRNIGMVVKRITWKHVT